MNLYPAIDVKDGACVRLVRGEMERATVFNDDPGRQAAAFAAQGFGWIHVVDLDGAFRGAPVNARAVAAILEAVSVPIQLGGGIRDMSTAAHWIEKGVRRIVLGTAAVRDPGFVAEAARTFPGQVAVSLDARGGRVAVEGWAEDTGVDVVDAARRLEDAGAAALVFTDIDRDGVLTGVNVAATAALAESVSLPVIASGGVASLDDIEALRDAGCPGIDGAIVGRALYDGRIRAGEALALLKGDAGA